MTQNWGVADKPEHCAALHKRLEKRAVRKENHEFQQEV